MIYLATEKDPQKVSKINQVKVKDKGYSNLNVKSVRTQLYFFIYSHFY